MAAKSSRKIRAKFTRKSKFYVYIVKCADGSYYTGYTNNLENRIKEHNNGKRGAKCLRWKLPVKLIWRKQYRYYRRALQAERRIKQLSHRQKQILVEIYEKSNR
jgi:putative endonuclease